MSKQNWDDEDLLKIHNDQNQSEWMKEDPYHLKENVIATDVCVDVETDDFDEVNSFTVTEHIELSVEYTYIRKQEGEHQELCPLCKALLESMDGGGVKCPSCGYWFCY